MKNERAKGVKILFNLKIRYINKKIILTVKNVFSLISNFILLCNVIYLFMENEK